MIRPHGQMLVHCILRMNLWNTAGTIRPSQRTIMNRFYSTCSSQSFIGVPDVVVDDIEKFKATFPEIVHTVVEVARRPYMKDVLERYAKILEYNVPGGRNSRALSIMSAYRSLVESPICNEEQKLVYIMAWCAEMMQAMLLITDDILDGAEERRNHPCWHLLDNTGLKVQLDVHLLDGAVYILLDKYFCERPYYSQIVNCFRYATMTACIGQILEMNFTENFLKTRKFHEFTMEKYKALVVQKTSVYSIHVPLSITLYLAGIGDPEKHRQLEKISLEIGEMFQIQNDYFDSFGDFQLTGKAGTDISGGRCTWPIVVALQRVNSSQKEILEKCFGKKSREDVEAVINVYSDVGIPAVYIQHREVALDSLKNLIQHTSRNLPPKMFDYLLGIFENPPMRQ